MKRDGEVTGYDRVQIMDLIRETFHRGRRGNAFVEDALCGPPRMVWTSGWYGFTCLQRCPAGRYRVITSTRRILLYSYGDRVTTIGPWLAGHPPELLPPGAP